VSSSKSTLRQQNLLRQQIVPQQIRFVKMLELTDAEVREEIDREMAENPALEMKIDPQNLESASPHYSPYSTASAHRYRPDDDDSEPQQAAPALTLHESLAAQLRELTLPRGVTAELCAQVIGAIDNNGYLTRTPAELLYDIELAADSPQAVPTLDQVIDAIDAVQQLDPPGVGALDARQCLTLQARRLPAGTPGRADALEILAYYFDIYSRRNFAAVEKAASMSAERIAAANAFIRSLNPKPGAGFAADDAEQMGNAGVTPDFVVEVDAEASRVSVSMPNSLPQLQIEQSFQIGSDEASEGETQAEEFVRTRRADARTFIEMLRRRSQTLMAIVKAIVAIQSRFFLEGDDESCIRPMVLRNIQERTGIDITMISRAISGKWLATPLGVYPLKSFFNNRGAQGLDSPETSSPQIKAALREAIDAEDPAKPLTDEALVGVLQQQGLKVARRTVAKYRDAMSIPGARLRRR
jgi:RNA polymerase sigma-54 factor